MRDGCVHLEVVQPGVHVTVTAQRRRAEVWHHVKLHLAGAQQERATQTWKYVAR